MLKLFAKYTVLTILINFFILFSAKSEVIKDYEIVGNDRIPNETILMFSNFKIGDDIDENKINIILKNLYETNFFQNVELKLKNEKLLILVKENPLIQNIDYNGIKSKKILEEIKKGLNLKSRSSYNQTLLAEDKNKILNTLQGLGYYFSNIETSIETLDDNKVNISYDIDIGNKAKLKKITFIGDKIYKSSKLKNIIVSEEYKFWKFISGRKYLKEDIISLDKRLLRNFYLNKGFYDVKINSSFAKLIENDEFELIFNINANKKFFFGKLDLNLPDDYDRENFSNIEKLFSKIEGEPYSLNSVRDILDEIDLIVLSDQFETINAVVNESFDFDKINLEFTIKESNKFIVEKINIFGNNITRENVIRNNIILAEGDIYNDILTKKSENNIKSLNIFKSVKANVKDGSEENSKIIEIEVEEKATGEIMAGAGVGTGGGTISFGVKENNYLGKGIKFDSNLTLDSESIKGQIAVNNPNYRNSDKSVFFKIQSQETDRLEAFGYKTNKTGFSVGTGFEYLNDLNLGLETSTFYEDMETDSSASSKQKSQAGTYIDTFVGASFDYDKRNQKFKTSKGFRSIYNLDLPVLSDTNTLTNTYRYNFYTELFEDNITSTSLMFKASNSLSNDNIKLSERLFIPSRRLRGFENGKIGPKDGEDFVGGNFISSLNFNSTIPQLFPNAQNFDFVFFVDMANVWGVDYDSSLDEDNDVRSSIGIGVDWLTVVGPMNFSLAQPISKNSGDITETFRFNLGTTF